MGEDVDGEGRARLMTRGGLDDGLDLLAPVVVRDAEGLAASATAGWESNAASISAG